MQMSLLRWWLFLLWMTRIEGLKKLWKPNESVVNHRIMKIILELCYENERLSNPIVIIGNFSESIDKSSVIKLDEFYNVDEEVQYTSLHGKVSYVASKIILIEDSATKLASDLTLLRRTRWWDHMALFFIVEKNEKTCGNFVDMLITTWKMDILNSVYICTESNNTTALYTFNPIANYAPSPWRRREVHPAHLHMFHRIFDSDMVCENLHYDKTKILYGYEVTVIDFGDISELSGLTRIPLSQYDKHFRSYPPYLLLHGLFTPWGVTARLEKVKKWNDLRNHFGEGTADIAFFFCVDCPYMNHLIPTRTYDEWIVAVKSRQEISTLTEIQQLWSFSVLIVSATALSTLLIVLTIQRHNFSKALLDLIRLLTHRSISANNRSHKFRIYLTTMLIFIVIISGVFQGFIVTFLVKPESITLPQTLEELQELEYKIYASPFNVDSIRALCLKCDVEWLDFDDCIKSAQDKPYRACLLNKIEYRPAPNVIANLDFAKTPVLTNQNFLMNRPNWPLRNRVIEGFSRLYESGLLNFWTRAVTEKERFENQAREAERSSPHYKPLKLSELTFAFQVLGLGLAISTVVFFMELLVAKCRKHTKINSSILRLNRYCNKTGC